MNVYLNEAASGHCLPVTVGHLHGLKNVVYELLRSLCVCIVRVKINNEELFLMLSRLKIHIILFLDRLRCGA